ncbi:hypothetical protein ACFYVL_28615 [Streptomyces sp. NPDC004111]|uniref:hypothetical protein n=1 Tax=Streptomyces sp. NPDC004111 TaxID=3364690 RepID=UPI0036C9FD42
MRSQKRAVALATAALSVGGLFAVGTAPGAAAAPAQSQARAVPSAPATLGASGVAAAAVNARVRCAWPRVCFYRNSTLKAAYKDRGYQRLGSGGRSSNVVVNSRRDDGARIYLQRRNGSGKHWECARPGRSYRISSGWMPYAINIRNSPSCR